MKKTLKLIFSEKVWLKVSWCIMIPGVIFSIWWAGLVFIDVGKDLMTKDRKKVIVPAKVLPSSSVVSHSSGFSNSIEQEKFCSLKNIRSFEVRDFLYGKFQTNILFSNNASAFGGLSLHRVEVTQTRTNRGYALSY